MLAIVVNTADYTNIKFYGDNSYKESAIEEFNQLVEDEKENSFGDPYGIVLIDVSGPGNFQINHDFVGDENVEIIMEWINNDNED